MENTNKKPLITSIIAVWLIVIAPIAKFVFKLVSHYYNGTYAGFNNSELIYGMDAVNYDLGIMQSIGLFLVAFEIILMVVAIIYTTWAVTRIHARRDEESAKVM
ncbi:hypothetical protein NXH67_16080 [Butyrivibrio sp. DSM 10294]|jgi:hypothetical protein|uniref:hypothetical protein n=1 Tax=Butyrivibrio sp. DSM 10294 TaxID=2972457 RepID=UPI00234E6099|nr:hypothetical protein [Butyrivibrio sp. DSM 10294]MDC7295031.1 hypothetical protein [Butyrivibrio sp. DSM 10294]